MREDDRDAGPADGGGLGRLPADLVVGVCILLFCAVAYGVTLTFDRAPAAVAQNVQPATFPRLVLTVIAVLTVVMMALGRAPGRRRRALPAMVWISGGVMIGFVLAFQWLGILPAMVILCLGLPVLWGERRWALIVPFALGFPLAVYLLFVEVLEVYFEPSPLVFW